MTKRCFYTTIISAFLSSVSPYYSVAETNPPVIFSTTPPDITSSAPIVCWSETRDVPRPVKIHFIRIDLSNPDYEIFTMISDDPDGKGPADAKLEEPEKLAKRYDALVAVNANAFQSMKDNKKETDIDWFPGKPIRITGLAVSNGVLRSKLSPSHFAFWIDLDGKPRMGMPGENDKIKEAVSDWSGYLVHKNKIIVTSREKLHPRTLLGLDISERWLFLVAVDGRLPEISEGMNLYEAAELMKKTGCHEAMALDGGGSSIMLARDPSTGKLTLLNNPAGEKPRPVPVMLGVRKREVRSQRSEVGK